MQSAANGIIVHEDTITFFAMGRTGQPQHYVGASPGGNRSMATATLRRDGFASLETTGAGLEPSLVTTVPVQFAATQSHMFVNVRLSPGGFIQVDLPSVPSPTLTYSYPNPNLNPKRPQPGRGGIC